MDGVVVSAITPHRRDPSLTDVENGSVITDEREAERGTARRTLALGRRARTEEQERGVSGGLAIVVC